MIKYKAIVMSDWDLRSTSRLQDKIQSTQSARWRTNEIKDPTDWSVSSNEVGHLTVHHVVFLAFMMDHLTMAPSHFERILDHTSCDFIYHRKYMKRNIWVDSLYSNYVFFLCMKSKKWNPQVLPMFHTSWLASSSEGNKSNKS